MYVIYKYIYIYVNDEKYFKIIGNKISEHLRYDFYVFFCATKY